MHAGIARLLIACIILLAFATPASDMPKVVITPVEVSRGAGRANGSNRSSNHPSWQQADD
jgi:hypothetical protein